MTSGRVRLYYKSLPLIFSALELPLRALVLPFRQITARFRSKSGVDLDVPPWAWDQLPNMCRLARIGARWPFRGRLQAHRA